jgi:hypothetical protein
MRPKPFPLRVLGVSLRLVLFLGVGPASGAAQATGGFTTALALATEAAVRAVTTRVYPVALYAGRDEHGIPRYIQRPFSDEERRLLREHFGIEEPGRLYLSDTVAGAHLNYDTERDPGAGRLVRSYHGRRSLPSPPPPSTAPVAPWTWLWATETFSTGALGPGGSPSVAG